jgi:hypothetical protein
MIKTMTIDGFYNNEEVYRLSNIIGSLKFENTDFGKEIQNFNLTPEHADDLFSNTLKIPVEMNEEQSGVFRYPQMFIHFEGFDSTDEWVYAIAIEPSTFNIFHHKSGAKNAIDGYQFNYRNLFEWDLMVNYLLEPGQGVLFRPWLFHSFDSGLIQVFRLKDKNVN